MKLICTYFPASVSNSVITFRYHYKDQTVAQLIAVYSEIDTKRTSTLNGHIEEIQDVQISVTRYTHCAVDG
jgi:hypothetical protein